MKGQKDNLYHFILTEDELEDFKKIMNEPLLENQLQYRYLKNRFLAIIKSFEEE